jgi:hypothetical protein
VLIRKHLGLRIRITLMADPDPAFHFNAEPDPAPHENDENLRPLVYRQTLQGPIVSVHVLPRLHFEPLKLSASIYIIPFTRYLSMGKICCA